MFDVDVGQHIMRERRQGTGDDHADGLRYVVATGPVFDALDGEVLGDEQDVQEYRVSRRVCGARRSRRR